MHNSLVDHNMTAHDALTIETFVFESPQKDGSTPQFKIAAKRYTHDSFCSGGLSLLMVHGTGFHKESWEPTLKKLIKVSSNPPGHRNLREVWSFDAPSHGDSAVLNAQSLKHRMDNVSVSEIAAAIVALVDSQHLTDRPIVVIGHSAGSSAAMYSTKLYPPGDIPFTSIILVEPPMIDRDVFNQHWKDRERQTGYIAKALIAQKNTWPTREAAQAWLSSRSPWKSWDDRVLGLYVKHALKEISETSPDVATKCSKKQEAYGFLDFEPTFDALDQIASVCKKIPIHVIFGEINDMVPRYSQDSVIDVTKGRSVASVRRIPGEGHNIVLEHPDVLAENLLTLIHGNVHSPKL